MTSHHLPQPPENHEFGFTEDGAVRGAAPELLLAAFAGSALIPFIQAMATRAGEDLYTRIRHLFRADERGDAETQLAADRRLILVDETARAVLQIPSTLSIDDARALAAAHVTRPAGSWILVAWDPARVQWTVRTIDDPPTEAIRVTGATS